MKKKIYEKPEMRAVEIQTKQFIATSGGERGFDVSGGSTDNYDEDTSFGSATDIS